MSFDGEKSTQIGIKGMIEALSERELGNLAWSILKSADCLVVFLDLDGKVEFLNDFGLKTLGLSAEKVTEVNWVTDFIPTDEREQFRKRIQSVKDGEVSHSDEYYLIRSEGSRRRFTWTACPIRNTAGESIGIAGVGIDVTREARIRQGLEEDEARLRAALENMVDGFITIDETGRIETFNPAAERMFGYEAEEVVGRNVTTLMPEPYRSEHGSYISEYLETGEAKIIGIGREVEGRRKDGSPFPLSLAVAEVRSVGRRMFVGNLRDLSRERELESVIESEQRLKAAIVESSTDAISALDPDGNILSWNQAAEGILGYRAEEILGRHYSILIPPDLQAEGEEERLAEIFEKEGEIQNHQSRRLRKDGREVRVMVSRKALRNEKGALIGYSAILRDITEDISLREQLFQSEKFSAIGELAAGLAHEIGGPLSVICGNAEFLLESIEEEDPRREDVVGISKECEAIASLMRRILDFSKPAKMETETVDVNECLRNVLVLVQKQVAKEAIEVKLDLQAGLPPILGDPNHLEQIIMNLVINARHAMPKGGTLQIQSFATQEISGNHRRVVGIRISDTGVGISEENLSRIFDPFYTTREQGEGTGLGLAVTQRIVTDHQGRISVRSLEGDGTAFTVDPAMNEEGG